jgi:hypothetical protein
MHENLGIPQGVFINNYKILIFSICGVLYKKPENAQLIKRGGEHHITRSIKIFINH